MKTVHFSHNVTNFYPTLRAGMLKFWRNLPMTNVDFHVNLCAAISQSILLKMENVHKKTHLFIFLNGHIWCVGKLISLIYIPILVIVASEVSNLISKTIIFFTITHGLHLMVNKKWVDFVSIPYEGWWWWWGWSKNA